MHSAGQIRDRARLLGRELRLAETVAQARPDLAHPEVLLFAGSDLPTPIDQLFVAPAAVITDGFTVPGKPLPKFDLPCLPLFQDQTPIEAPSAFDDVVMRDESDPAAAMFEPNFADVQPVADPTLVDPILEPGEVPEEMLAVGMELRAELRLSQKLELYVRSIFADIEQIYAAARKLNFELAGLNIEVALIDRGTLPHTSSSAGVAYGDRAFVVQNFFRDMDPETADVFTLLIAVHEYGEVLFQDHHKASLLEFAVAESMGILDFYLKFLQNNYDVKMRDVSLYRLNDDVRDFLGERGQTKDIAVLEALASQTAAREEELKTERDQQRAVAEGLIAGLIITPEMQERYAELFSSTSELTGKALSAWIDATAAQDVFERAANAVEQKLQIQLARAVEAQKVAAVFFGVLAVELSAAYKALSEINDEHIDVAANDVMPELMARARAVIENVPYLDAAQKAAILAHPLFNLEVEQVSDVLDLLSDGSGDNKIKIKKAQFNFELAERMAQASELPSDLMVRVKALQELDLDEKATIGRIQNAARYPWRRNLYDYRDVAMTLVKEVIGSGLPRLRNTVSGQVSDAFARSLLAAHPRLHRELNKAFRAAVKGLEPNPAHILHPKPTSLPAEFADPMEDLFRRAQENPASEIADVFSQRYTLENLLELKNLSDAPPALVYTAVRNYLKKVLSWRVEAWMDWRMVAMGSSSAQAANAFAERFSHILPKNYYRLSGALQERLNGDDAFWADLAVQAIPRIEGIFTFVRANADLFPEWAQGIEGLTPQSYWQQIVEAFNRQSISSDTSSSGLWDAQDAFVAKLGPYLRGERELTPPQSEAAWSNLQHQLLRLSFELSGYGDVFQRVVERRILPAIAEKLGISVEKAQRRLGTYRISAEDSAAIREASRKIPYYASYDSQSRSYFDYSPYALQRFYQEMHTRQSYSTTNYGLSSDDKKLREQIRLMIASLPEDLKALLEPRLRALLP